MRNKNVPCILITGASGFLGSLLSNFLSNKFNILHLTTKDLTEITIHKQAFNSLEKQLSKKRIFAIIHLAAYVHKRDLFKDSQVKKKIYFSNVEITKAIANLAIALKVKKFIFSSTVGVYGSGTYSNQEAFDTYSPTIPNNIYSASKLSAEYALQNIFSDYAKKLVILRISSVLSQESPGSLRLLKLFAIKSIPFPIFSIFKNNIPTRSFTTINDFNFTILQILLNRVKGGFIYNVCSKRCTVISLLNFYCKEDSSPSYFHVKINLFISRIILNTPFIKHFMRPLLLSHNINSILNEKNI